MAVATRRLTADQFLSLPPDQARTQLIDGEVVVTEPGVRHQRLVGEVFRLLAGWLAEHPGTGEAGLGCNWRIDDANVFAPDVWFIKDERRPGDVLFVDGAPDLVVEVRSPSTWRFDIGAKRDGYRRRGTSEIWLVDTEADVVLVFAGEQSAELGRGDVLTTSLVPGLAVELSALFDR
ncbi:MAG: Uma2 family endonuclease [Actinomycetota bacterium]